MTEDNNLQPSESKLAQRIWQRHVVSPGVIQMKPVLHIMQHHRWSLQRVSLSADIQRRWLPSGSAPDPVNWSALPFLRAPSTPQRLISRSPESAPAGESQLSIAPAEQVPAQPERTVSIDRETTVSSTSPVPQLPVQIMRSAFTSPSSTDMPPRNIESLISSSQASSDVLGSPTEASSPAQTSLLGPAVESVRPHQEEMIARVSRSEGMPIVSPSTLTAKPVSPDVPVLQRQVSVPGTQTVQPDDTPLSRMAAREEPIVGQAGDPGRFSSVVLQRARSETIVTLPVRTSVSAIQRTALGAFESSSERMSSPLPLVRPLPVHTEDTPARSLIQMMPAADPQRHQPPLVTLIQRQTQTTEVPASSSSTSSTTPLSAPAPAAESSSAGGVDIDKISEEILRIILNRMAVERERRGIGLWH